MPHTFFTQAASEMSKMALRFSLISLVVGVFAALFGWVVVMSFSGEVRTVLQIVVFISTSFITLILRFISYLSNL